MTIKKKKLLTVVLFISAAAATGAIQAAHHHWEGLIFNFIAVVWCILYANHVDDCEIE